MRIIDFKEKFNEDICLALGFFDTLHIGHRELIGMTAGLNGIPAVFTFNDDLGFKLGYSRQVYTFSERVKLMEEADVKILLCSDSGEDFLNLTAQEFLDTLTSRFSVKAIVCGRDYMFGKGAAGDVQFLEEYCKKKGILFMVDEDVIYNGERASTTLAKRYLDSGDIENLNKLLVSPYLIAGTVIHGRKVGRTLGFPTINMLVKDKYPLRPGVYLVKVLTDAGEYKGLANFGARPTFKLAEELLEIYLDGFSGDLYGKPVEVRFFKLIRPIMEFSGVKELKKQIEEDKKFLL